MTIASIRISRMSYENSTDSRTLSAVFNWRCNCTWLIIGFIWLNWRFIQTPFGFERLFLNSRIKFKLTNFIWDESTFVFRFETRDQFCSKMTSFLRIQITNFFWYINQGVNLRNQNLYHNCSGKVSWNFLKLANSIDFCKAE